VTEIFFVTLSQSCGGLDGIIGAQPVDLEKISHRNREISFLASIRGNSVLKKPLIVKSPKFTIDAPQNRQQHIKNLGGCGQN
jgi:hypothetical protein